MIYRLNTIGHDALHSTKNPWHLYIKIFKDIPIPDLEVIYPKKIVTMKTMDLLKFTLTVK